jgi:hypothetical protein
MNILDLTVYVRNSNSRRCKFGRIWQRFCSFVAAVRGICNLNGLSRSRHVLFGLEFSAVRRNTMHKFFLALTLLSLSVSTGAVAQQQRSGTPEEQKACSRDVQRHCRPLIDQGDLVILSCLQQNRPKLSSACDKVLKDHGQ